MECTDFLTLIIHLAALSGGQKSGTFFILGDAHNPLPISAYVATDFSADVL